MKNEFSIVWPLLALIVLALCGCIIITLSACAQLEGTLPDGTHFKANTLGKDITIKNLDIPGVINLDGYIGESQEATLLTPGAIISTD